MIVPMKRLTLIALKADEAAIMKALQRAGAVEVISRGEEADDAALRERLDQDAQRMQTAAELLKPYGKKPPMGPKPERSADELYASTAESAALTERAEALGAKLAALRQETEKHRALIEQLSPWRELTAPVESIRPTKNIRFETGFLKLQAVESLLEAGFAAEVFPAGQEAAVLIAANAKDQEALQQTLKDLEFAEYSFPAVTGTPAAAIAKAEGEIASLEKQADETLAALKETAEKRAVLLEGIDANNFERERAAAANAVEKTQSTFVLEGWVREDEVEKAEQAVAAAADVFSFEVRDPLPEENPPSAMKNHKLVEPFESIVTMYAYPSYRGIDATAVTAPFYFLFFGMMLSDSGYGLALFIGGLLFSKFLKPQGGMAKLVKVITYGGLSAALCGPFIGTFFGMNWNDMFNTTIFPLLFDPMVDVMPMMLLSCGLGLAHMYTGIIVKMYMCFRDGDPQSAIFDQLSWMLLLTGLILIFVAPNQTIKTVAIVLTALGGGMLLLFSGRSKKNPFMRIGSGLGALYNITGYLSDILSYVRIFALGLVSGAMGMVFNLIGGMVHDAFGGLGVAGAVIGTILAAAVLLVLHVFSLFINTLGAYAHCARLQFIEFYGKFYEADGREFKPLRFNAKSAILRDK
ncbi:MAG: V-type ATP synthase subunit I [Clostridiales bacterium]|nr:V-type ATP synthase subunit I [Clostridiales bacterium]